LQLLATPSTIESGFAANWRLCKKLQGYMAVCVINKFTGISAERFLDTFPNLLPQGLPPYVSNYIGAVNNEGLTVIAVFETAEALDALMERLPPMLESVGFPMPITTRLEVVPVNVRPTAGPA
jgi:hypothetical protein